MCLQEGERNPRPIVFSSFCGRAAACRYGFALQSFFSFLKLNYGFLSDAPLMNCTMLIRNFLLLLQHTCNLCKGSHSLILNTQKDDHKGAFETKGYTFFSGNTHKTDC